MKIENNIKEKAQNEKISKNSDHKINKTNNQKLPIIILSVAISLGLYYFYPNGAKIEGIIKDSKDPNLKLNGVEVLVDNKIKVTTNELTGKYTIQNLEEGSHNITFSKDGYIPITKNINLSKGEKISLDVSLDFNLKKEDLPSKILLTLNQNSSSISAIDITKNSQVFNLPIGSNPILGVLSKRNSKFFTYNIGENTISNIDLKTQSEKRFTLEKASQISKIELSSEESKLFALNMSMKKIHIIDVNNNTLLSDINLDKTYTDFVINKFNNEIILLDDYGLVTYSSSGTKISEIKFAKSFPRENMKYFDNTKKVFFTSSLVNNILGYDLIKNEGINIDLKEKPVDYTLGNYGNKLYILFKNHLSIFDLDRSIFINENIDIGLQNASKLEKSSNNDYIYINDSLSNIIKIFDTKTDNLIASNILLTESVNKVFYWDN